MRKTWYFYNKGTRTKLYEGQFLLPAFAWMKAKSLAKEYKTSIEFAAENTGNVFTYTYTGREGED